MGVSGVCLCGPVLACFAWGRGEEGAGGREVRGKGGHQCANVLRRRVVILHSLFRNGLGDRSTMKSLWFLKQLVLLGTFLGRVLPVYPH